MKLSDVICPSFVAGAMVSLAISASAYVFVLKPDHYVNNAYELGQIDVALNVLMDKGNDRPKEYWLEDLASKGNPRAATMAMGGSVNRELEAMGATKDSLKGLLEDKVTYALSDKILLQSMETMTDVNLREFLTQHKLKFVPSEKKLMEKEIAGQKPNEVTWVNFSLGTRLSEIDQARLTGCLEKLEADWPSWKGIFNVYAKGLCAIPSAAPASAP
ncbi:hypothetical protein [Pseudomonas serbica]|jgi:hypothetical protein|uniref:hypothetical protein n=1 Tax=Pseudomonas serbica TaxID=2965074 RepID=UPI00237A63CE|nr:hypothetical protein [Pseudomonas serbica]